MKRSKDHLLAMLMLAHRAKEAVLLDFGVRAESRTGSKVLHRVLKRLISITQVSCERGLACLGETFFGTLELLAQYDDFLNQHIQKLVKLGSRPYQLCVLNNSVGCWTHLFLQSGKSTSFSYHYSSAIRERGTACQHLFLGKFNILSPDEIERLAEKLVTLYQDDIKQRLSNELLQFVDYSNEFLDYAEDTIGMWQFLYQLTIDKRIKCSFPNVEIALRTNLIVTVTNCSGNHSFSKLK